ncbi:hypothetical protein BAE44_0003130 [Dichanthelium oligosanthes]|uniref:Disease resistance N-terminal domain-containing protein n=1 Tax=Dichanthelium oligosanthes TaxID=888268 RepID=A0A1E5WF76_9POAL|nr:hypothetical protein BAE44_0003130 [Dichanthelium oligosanthes]
MAEIVGSAVVGETVNRIIASVTGKNEKKDDKRENIESLEMAHIKMEAALPTSDKWQVTDVPLLRWRSKLKRAAQECDDTLHQCKQQALEEEETRQRVRQSSFPKRIAHATKSFISSVIDFSDDKSSGSSANVRRFERFADDKHPLKLAVLIIPHDSPEDTETMTETCAYEVIGEDDQAGIAGSSAGVARCSNAAQEQGRHGLLALRSPQSPALSVEIRR